MRRSISVSDLFYRFTHAVMRNKMTVIIYALFCMLFTVVGVTVGVKVSDKLDYVLGNGADIFELLRGDIGIVSFFFFDILMISVYCVFASSMFLNRPLNYLSVMPCGYRSYVLGMQVCVIIGVFNVSALPMLFVLYVPACIVEITVLCILSCKCFAFTSINCGVFPSRCDLKTYYYEVLKHILFLAFVSLLKALTLLLFASALIGVV